MNSIIDVFSKPDYHHFFSSDFLTNMLARPGSDNKIPESLVSHSQLSLEVFDLIVKELDLKPVFVNLFEKSFGYYNEKHWDILRAIVYYHDFGKMNTAFQERMRNPNSKKTEDSDHALPGLFLFGSLLNTYLSTESEFDKSLLFYISSAIARHHTRLESPMEIGEKVDNSWGKSLTLLKNIYPSLKSAGNDKFFSLWFNPTTNSPKEKPGAIFRYLQDNLPEDSEKREALFYLHKLFYSCLISSDYYAASYQGEKIPSSLCNTLSDLKSLTDRFGEFLSGKKSNDEISVIREKFRNHAHGKLNQNKDKRVFYLYLPTGGGKTLTSLSLALSLSENFNSKRLFYVFPFVNIIEQNQEVISSAIGADIVSPIYSYSDWDLKENENDKIHFINQEFTNYPVVVLSNVNFFNSIIKSSKSANYKLHNFANSVIVIDEIQSLNAKEWTLYNDLITNLAKMLNSRIIVMSASIPPIFELSDDEKIKTNICELISPQCPDLNQYFEKFWNRVTLHPVKEQDIVSLSLEKISENNYPSKVLIVTNTIKKSLDVYQKINKKLSKTYNVILLNSTMLPSRRKEIISMIKNPPDGQKLLLVSTQSVEAGLDVDFDIGIRELAPLDNLLQICGRVNRNMKTTIGNVYVSKDKTTSKDSVVYGKLRFGGKDSTDNMQEKIVQLLENKEQGMDLKYNIYSSDLVARINKQNKEIYKENQRHSVDCLRDLDFDSLNMHNVIECQSVSVFVPLDINISGKNKLSDLAKQFDLNITDNHLLWSQVHDKYISLCKSKNIQKRHQLKKFAPLLNQFVISLSFNRASKLGIYVQELFKSDSKNKYSSFLMFDENRLHDIYSLDNGLDAIKIDSGSDDAIIF